MISMIDFKIKRFEAIPSTRDRSVREMKFGPHRITHRFGIKGGMSFSQVLAENIMQNNALFERLKKRNVTRP